MIVVVVFVFWRKWRSFGKNNIKCAVDIATHQQELICRWDGREMLHKSNFRFSVGIPLFNALFLSNLWAYHYKLNIAKN